MNLRSILFINYTSDISGSSIALSRLLSAAKSFYKVKVLADSGSYIHRFSEKSELSFSGIPIPKLKNLSPILLSKYFLQNYRFKKKIKKEIKEFKPDIILSNCLPNISITYCLKPNQGPKLIWWVHELELHPLWVKKRLLSRVLKWGSHIFAVSQPVVEMLGKNGNVSLLPNIIPQGHMNSKNIFENKILNLLWVGTISPRKGFHMLADILRQIRQNGYSIRLEVIGSLLPQYENYYRESKKAIEQLNSDSRFLLNVEPDDVPYASHKILIQTSFLPESFSLPVAESMSHGMLVFAPVLGGMQDYCKHLVNMVDYRDAAEIPEYLRKMERDNTLLTKIQKETLITSKKFSEHNSLKIFNETLNALAGNN